MRLLDDVTGPVLVHGITGRAGRRFAPHMRAYGTDVVGGVAPGHGGETVDGMPVFDTVERAVDATGARVVVAMLPPARAAAGLLECAHAGIRLTVCVTEGIGQHDLLLALQVAADRGMRIVGPNTAGLLVPGRVTLGFLPTAFAEPGRCALLSRSGTLSYEVAYECARAGVGLSAWIGVGGDGLKGAAFADLFPELAAHDGTDALVLVGEIGTRDEEDVAPLVAHATVPVVALIAGRSAPRGVAMGHAGAFVGGPGGGSWESKVETLRAAGAQVVTSPRAAADAVRDALAEAVSR